MSDASSEPDGNGKSTLWPLFVGAGLIFSGLASLLYFAPKSLFWKVLNAGIAELGFAFVIAWIVSVTLEARSRQHHDREIQARNSQFEDEIKRREKLLNKNIFDYIYSVRLPKELFLSVEEHIFQSPFLKEKQRIEYNFEDWKDGWQLIRGEFEFTIRNVSRDRQKYPVQFYIEKELGHEAAPFEKQGFYKAIIGGRDLTKQEIEKADKKASDSEEYKRFEELVELEAGEILEIRLGFYLRKRTTDSEIWQTMDLCSKLDVHVRYNPKEYDLHITPVHPSDKFDMKDEDEFGVRARLNEPLLKGHGVFLWWSPCGGEMPRLEDRRNSDEVPKT